MVGIGWRCAQNQKNRRFRVERVECARKISSEAISELRRQGRACRFDKAMPWLTEVDTSACSTVTLLADRRWLRTRPNPDNLYTCCRSCNSSRQEKSLARFAGRRAAVIRRSLRRSISPYLKLAKATIR